MLKNVQIFNAFQEMKHVQFRFIEVGRHGFNKRTIQMRIISHVTLLYMRRDRMTPFFGDIG